MGKCSRRCRWIPAFMVIVIILAIAVSHTHITMTHHIHAPPKSSNSPSVPPTTSTSTTSSRTNAGSDESGALPQDQAWASMCNVGGFWCIVAMVLYCQFSIMFSHAGSVRKQDLPVLQSIVGPSDSTSILKVACIETKANGCRRYCKKCKQWKPDRTHHCHDCGVCTLKLDHHCGFLNNCIGFHTHKHFVLFLFYGALGSCYAAISLLSIDPFSMLRRTSDKWFKVEVMAELIAATAFAIVLALFFVSHVLIISKGYTTIEYMEKKGNLVNGKLYRNPYDLGRIKSLSVVLGSSPLYWLIPLPLGVDKGRGLTFEVNRPHPQSLLRDPPSITTKSKRR